MKHFFYPLLAILILQTMFLGCASIETNREVSGPKVAADDSKTLAYLEKTLLDEREKIQYYKVKPKLQNNQARIEMLQLKTYEQRQQWLITQGINTKTDDNNSEIDTAIENHDIILGMGKDSVRKSWGDPEQIEYAGNPIYQNERWKYTKQIALPSGYKQEKRIVYFEAGRVVGWETE